MCSQSRQLLTKNVTRRQKWSEMLKLLSYPRGVVLSLFIGVYTILMSANVLFLRSIGFSRDYVDRVIQTRWARLIMWLSGVTVEVRGAENIPTTKEGFLAVFNHTSHVDILTLYGYMPRMVRFGAKIELFKIPFFGRAMLAMGALPIDRRLREKVLQLYQAAIPRVADGDAFALAPEGTRQSEQKVGRFKFGPFLFAIQAQMNIVPVVIAGAFDVLPKNSLCFNAGAWRRKVILQILTPVSTKGLNEDDIDTLQASVHESMSQTLERLKLEL
jgi:1-acyl-sn-glycerol-3-phosphate acyltransferase